MIMKTGIGRSSMGVIHDTNDRQLALAIFATLNREVMDSIGRQDPKADTVNELFQYWIRLYYKQTTPTTEKVWNYVRDLPRRLFKHNQ